MEPLDLRSLPQTAPILVDTPPIIYFLEGHPRLASRFAPLFEAQARGELQLAVTTVTIAEVLTGAMKPGSETLVRRYRTAFESWHVVPLTVEIAESAARLRASLRVKLADSVQVASALAINAAALVTHDRDFSRVRSLRIVS